MKDLVISSKMLKKELLILLSCFIAVCLVNIVSIIVFKTSFWEIFTQLGYVVVITVVLYVLAAVMRLLIYSIRKIFKRTV